MCNIGLWIASGFICPWPCKNVKVMSIILMLFAVQFKKKSANGTFEVSLLACRFYLPCTLLSVVGAHSETGCIFNFKNYKKENKGHEGLNHPRPLFDAKLQPYNPNPTPALMTLAITTLTIETLTLTLKMLTLSLKTLTLNLTLSLSLTLSQILTLALKTLTCSP